MQNLWVFKIKSKTSKIIPVEISYCAHIPGWVCALSSVVREGLRSTGLISTPYLPCRECDCHAQETGEEMTLCY